MKKLKSAFQELVLDKIDRILEEIAESMEAHMYKLVAQQILLLLAAGVSVVGLLALVLGLLYAARKVIFAVVAPVLMVIVLVASYRANHPTTNVSTRPAVQHDTIELARVRAERVYPLLSQTAFLIFSELCRYLPGLIKPFSLSAVVPPVHYDITASFMTIFHFIIAKGDNDIPANTMQEILESLIGQHLRAQDLPLAIPAIYTSTDGITWPGLVVDGVYDIGQHYRVDLVICNEVAVTRLKARTISMLDGHIVTETTIQDTDFD